MNVISFSYAQLNLFGTELVREYMIVVFMVDAGGNSQKKFIYREKSKSEK